MDQRGQQFTLGSLRGRTIVLADFLTLCQEVCPLTSVDLRDVATAVSRAGLADRVQVIEATVDPQRDTPARLAAYQNLFGAQRDWAFATGTSAGLNRLWAYLGVYHAKVAEQAGSGPKDWLTGRPLTYDVEHQDVVYVIGPDGHARWEDNGNADTAGSQPPGTLLQFLSKQGHRNLTAPTQPSWTAADIEGALEYVTGQHIG
ncbi:SCO family protein [Pedococcus bigeumensis]|uniref:SCO family protein n=1 Tax=Pedococcus bigeumensis TaxID=433644 RepID=UPI0031D47B31